MTWQHLERHIAVLVAAIGFINRCHPTFADEAFNGVFVEGLANQVIHKALHGLELSLAKGSGGQKSRQRSFHAQFASSTWSACEFAARPKSGWKKVSAPSLAENQFSEARLAWFRPFSSNTAAAHPPTCPP